MGKKKDKSKPDLAETGSEAEKWNPRGKEAQSGRLI